MKPLLFGDRDKPLFGAYHAPNVVTPSPKAVVLCYPIGHEYFKAHRAFRLLADQLGRAGMHVWRFDYYGTGDSAGLGEEGDVETWVANIELAIRELKSISLATRVSLIGLRFGASLAALAAVKDPSVERLVLWDPVSAAYIDELTASAIDAKGLLSPPSDTEIITVVGCIFSARVRRQIAAVDLSASLDLFPGEVLAVASKEGDIDHLRRSPNGEARFAAYELLSDGRNWAALDQETVIPQPALRWITARLTEA